MDSAGGSAKKDEQQYFDLRPVYDVHWVSATMMEFSEELRATPAAARAEKTRRFLRYKFPEIRDKIKSQWHLDGGWSLSEYGDAHNNYVYAALQVADKWRRTMEEKLRGGAPAGQARLGRNTDDDGGKKGTEEETSKDAGGRDEKLSAPAPTPLARRQSTLPQQGSGVPSAHGTASGTPTLPVQKPTGP